MNSKKMLLDLPIELFGKCLSYHSYKQISAVRKVCISFDEHCQIILNKGFITATKIHHNLSTSIKSQVPSHPWDAKSHPLRIHLDNLKLIELRITQLQKNYNQYIEWNLCCFIPGQVLDKMLDFLRLVKKSAETGKKLAGHSIIHQELLGKSMRARDHFQKFILPTFFVNKQELNFMKTSLKTQEIEIEKVKGQTEKIEADSMNSNRESQKIIQALSQKIIELESKINGENSARFKGQKVNIKRKLSDETETQKFSPPKKAKKMITNSFMAIDSV